ncbi:MAG: hypothetical protein HN855_07520 [Anaerolineae bacterium]|jgi:hypothetical protein|nr:hypothetical protein [Anaerolineae bacterium]
MKEFGIILVLVGFGMARSGFSMQAESNRYDKLVQRGIVSPVPQEYNYHVLFRKIWWVPLGVGLVLIYG